VYTYLPFLPSLIFFSGDYFRVSEPGLDRVRSALLQITGYLLVRDAGRARARAPPPALSRESPERRVKYPPRCPSLESLRDGGTDIANRAADDISREIDRSSLDASVRISRILVILRIDTLLRARSDRVSYLILASRITIVERVALTITRCIF